MTYAKLIRLSDEDFENMEYDAIFLDEVHRAGAPQTFKAVEKLFTSLPDAHKIGATATPVRMDNVDVISQLFNNIMAYTYTLLDAMQDGLLSKPNYCYCTYDYKTDLENQVKNEGYDPDDPEYQKMITTKTIEMAEIFNMENTIKATCDEYAVDTNYMKFIVFFANGEHMHEKLPEVIKWFHNAYPLHFINTLKISSLSTTESKNVEKLSTLKYRNNTIDLIACIDMLNLGYHVPNLTGVVMYRGTSSSTIFIQQLGRALSTDADNSSIVFDIVDNLHRKALFELRQGLTDKPIRSKRAKGANAPAPKITEYYISDTDGATLAFKDNKGKEVLKTNFYLNSDNNIVMSTPSGEIVPSKLIYNCDDGKIYDNSMGSLDPNKNINNITEECIVATGHMATYREFIKKAMVEPMVQKCKYVIELHFRTWCYNHNIEYPITDTKLQEMYNLTKDDFINELSNIINTNGIGYPLHDAEKLLEIGSDGKIAPLAVCAKDYNIAVNKLLDELGLSA